MNIPVEPSAATSTLWQIHPNYFSDVRVFCCAPKVKLPKLVLWRLGKAVAAKWCTIATRMRASKHTHTHTFSANENKSIIRVRVRSRLTISRIFGFRWIFPHILRIFAFSFVLCICLEFNVIWHVCIFFVKFLFVFRLDWLPECLLRHFMSKCSKTCTFWKTSNKRVFLYFIFFASSKLFRSFNWTFETLRMAFT